MSEPGIGSVGELLFFYCFFGFIILMLWGALDAALTTDATGAELERRLTTRQRVGRALAPLGVVHVAFAFLAHDLARFRHDDWPPSDDGKRQRAMTEAVVSAVAGVIALGLVMATIGE